MLRLIFTRHGQTKENADGIVQGHHHGNINARGLGQINSLIERLRKEKIDKVISSDVARCKVTTQKIVEELKLPVEYTSLIREKEDGEFVGKKSLEVKWEDLDGNFENRKAPNGENLIEVRERGRQFFNQVLDKYSKSDKTILIVSHGAFLKVLIGDLLGMSLYDSIFKLFIEHCSMTEIEINEKIKPGYRINFLNENNYLN